MDINSFVIGFKKGKESGGGEFPVKAFFEKTAEELDLKGVTVLVSGAISAQPFLTKLSIPDVRLVNSSAISGCNTLTSLTFPKSLEQLYASGVMMCSGLTTVTFEGTPNSIASQAFMSCASIRTVNVPWGQGEVANAPWGATFATINYNYKGD